jgi:hypothetical protein
MRSIEKRLDLTNLMLFSNSNACTLTNGRIAWLSIITTMYNYEMPLMLEIFLAYKDQSFHVVQMYGALVLAHGNSAPGVSSCWLHMVD